MSLKIRLRRMGRKKAPTYRIVVAESSSPRDGRFVANLGHYNPRTQPATLVVDQEKARAWIAKGAQPTDTVTSLLRLAAQQPAVEPSAVAGAVQAVKKTAGRATKAAGGVASRAAKAVQSVAAGVVETVQEAAAGVVETVQEVVDEVRERVSGEDAAEAPEAAAAPAPDAATTEDAAPAADESEAK